MSGHQCLSGSGTQSPNRPQVLTGFDGVCVFCAHSKPCLLVGCLSVAARLSTIDPMRARGHVTVSRVSKLFFYKRVFLK